MTINYNFEWDPQKAHANQGKHGVGFDEGATVFSDSNALTIFDPDHSETEDRWITMGISERGRILVAIHTFRSEKEKELSIRMISTRKANKRETKIYGERL